MRDHPIRFLLLAVLSTLALALAACGDDEPSEDVGDLGPDPATMAPADAPFYGEAVVRPDGTMLDDFNSAFGKLLGTEDTSAMLRDAVEQELASSEDGVSYSEDIEPWLGARIGGFVTDYDAAGETAEGAAVAAVTDAEAAQAFIDDQAETAETPLSDAEYNGVSYKVDSEEGSAVGISGDFLIAGTEQGFKDAVDAGGGDSLADSETATSAREEIPDNSLFSAFVDTAAVIDLVERSGELSAQEVKSFQAQIEGYSDGPVNFWGVVEESTMSIAASAPAPPEGSGPSELIGTFPADAWLAFATADVGQQIQASLEQFKAGFAAGLQSSGTGLDVDPIAEFNKATGINVEQDLEWIGDVGGFVQGASLLGVGGGLVLETDDEQAASESIDNLSAALQKQREVQVTPSDTGFTLQVAGAPIGAEVTVQDGKVVLAGGGATVDDVLEPSETLEGSDRFNTAQDALGDDLSASFFLDFAPVVALIESTGAATADPSYQMAKPYLDRLDFVVSGSKLDGDRTTGAFVVGVKDAPAETEDTSAAVITP